MLSRVDVCAVFIVSILALQFGQALAQDDGRRIGDDLRRAEEERRMSEARRAADRTVDRAAYVSADVSREQLGQLTASPTPPGAKPPSSSSGAAAGRSR